MFQSVFPTRQAKWSNNCSLSNSVIQLGFTWKARHGWLILILKTFCIWFYEFRSVFQRWHCNVFHLNRNIWRSSFSSVIQNIIYTGNFFLQAKVIRQVHNLVAWMMLAINSIQHIRSLTTRYHIVLKLWDMRCGCSIVLKFGWLICSSDAEAPIKYLGDRYLVITAAN